MNHFKFLNTYNMKKMMFAFAFVLFVFNANSQWYQKYGATNINELSKEQLNYSMQNAEKKIKTGKTLNFIGISSILIGSILVVKGNNSDVDSWDEFGKSISKISYGSLFIVAGSGMMAVGIPFWLVGKDRKNSIEVALVRFNSSSLSGCKKPIYFGYKQPSTFGLSLKINFL